MVEPIVGNRQKFSVEQTGNNVFTLRSTAEGFQSAVDAIGLNGFFPCHIEHNNGTDWVVFDTFSPEHLAQITSTSPVQITVSDTPFDSSQKEGRISSSLFPGDVGAGTPSSVDDIDFSVGEHDLVIGPNAGILGQMMQNANPNWVTFDPGVAAPNVKGHRFFKSSGTTPLTGFVGLRDGQMIFIYRGDADAPIQLPGMPNTTLTTTNPLAVIVGDNGAPRLLMNVGREAATSAEIITGTDTDKVVSPQGLNATRGQPGGYAGLNASGELEETQIPASIARSADLDAAIDGLEWQDSVLTGTVGTPPPSPTEGDRYLLHSGLTGALTGDWVGHSNEIAEFDGTDWQYTSPSEGMVVEADDVGQGYRFNGTAWVDKLSGVRVATEEETDEGTSLDTAVPPGRMWPSIIKSRGDVVGTNLPLTIGEVGTDWSDFEAWKAWMRHIRVADDVRVIHQLDRENLITKQLLFNSPYSNRMTLRGLNSDTGYQSISATPTIDSSLGQGQHRVTLPYTAHGMIVGDILNMRPTATDSSGDANFEFMQLSGAMKVLEVPNGDTLVLGCTSQSANLESATCSGFDIVRIRDRLVASGTKQTLNDADRNPQVEYNKSPTTDDSGIVEFGADGMMLENFAIEYDDPASVGQSGNDAYDEITGITARNNKFFARRLAIHGMPRNGVRLLRGTYAEMADCAISDCNTLDNSGNGVVVQTFATLVAQAPMLICGNRGGGLQVRSSSAQVVITQPYLCGNLSLGARAENHGFMELANPFIFGNPIGIELETSSSVDLVFNSTLASQIRATNYALQLTGKSQAKFIGPAQRFLFGDTSDVYGRKSYLFGPEGGAATSYYSTIDDDGTMLIDRIAPEASSGGGGTEEVVVDWTAVTPDANPFTFFDATTLESGVYRIQWMRNRTTGTAFTEFFLSIVGSTAGSRTFAGVTTIPLGISITLDNGSDLQINGAQGDASQYRVLRIKQRTNTPGSLL